jgi:ribosomal protein S18 acetylase RimI-like enzyme
MTTVNNPFKVTRVTSDNEELIEVASLFNEYRKFYGQPSDLDGALNFLTDRLEKTESVVFAVVENAKEKVVGFTQLYPTFSSISMKSSWILNDLYVLESYRGQGAAQLLLDAARNYALSTKAKELVLSTALDNLRAQSLYEKNGYVRDTEFYSYYLSL